MKNTKLNVAKALVLVALFCPAAFADGDQGSGGFADGDTPTTTACESSLEGDQGSGGLTAAPCEDVIQDDSVFESIFVYFDSMF